MANLDPSMRLKVNRDTCFVPDPSGGVYFRNNESSFQMEGSTIAQWIEKLIPLFNGERSMDELTAGLSPAYRERVYEIAGILYQNKFIRDVSTDLPHQLTEEVQRRFGSQIELIDAFGGSGAARFQEYRQSKVLAVGSGPFFVSLVSALLESGLPSFQMVVTESAATDRKRLKELITEASKHDAEVAVHEAAFQDWRSAVQPFDAVLYVSGGANTEGLKALHDICREEGKILIPAICKEQAGLAGPILYPGREGDLESALRSLHESSVKKEASLSSTSAAMLANLIVFEWLKEVTGIKEAEQNRQFYLLDLETLEGNWHSFWQHPLVRGGEIAGKTDREAVPLLLFFSRLTSKVNGIFHKWEEGDLQQLPLPQCLVQPVNPLSRGPAELLPEIICTGLTHEEARREAGLAGIEAYVSELSGDDQFSGIGAGETAAEGACRALEKALEGELNRQEKKQNPVYRVALNEVEDEHCRYYLQALQTLYGTPSLALGKKICGFPVVWAGVDGKWFRSAGLNLTLAMRRALQQTIGKMQNRSSETAAQPVLLENVIQLSIPAYEEFDYDAFYAHAEKMLTEEGRTLKVVEIPHAPLFKDGIAGVFGVYLNKEGSK